MRLKERRAALVRPLLAGLFTVLVPSPGAAAAAPPEKVAGTEACTECHLDQIQVWKQTVHQKTFRTLPPRPETAAMLARLGLTKVKGEKQCQDCHFLGQIIDDEYQTVAGISCESCHGAARDWAKTHGDYGHGIIAETEAPEHRAARRAQAVAAGMAGPRELYALGATCYGCHIVTDEKIVNTGGHPAGSPGFSLLTWSQGEVRHTIPRTGDKLNPEAPLARRRVFFVLGCILETETCFRAVAEATARAPFGVTQAHRADAARQLLEKIQALAPVPELAEIAAVARATRLRLHNRGEILAAAEEIGRLGRAFAGRVTGDQLAGVDPLLPGAESYKGKPHDFLAAP